MTTVTEHPFRVDKSLSARISVIFSSNFRDRPITMGWTPPHLPASMCQTEFEYSVNDKEEPEMKINRIGVDLAKNVFQLHGVNKEGVVMLTKKISRKKLPEFIT